MLGIVMFDKVISGFSLNEISRGEGLVLLSVLILYVYSLVLTASKEKMLVKERHKLTFKDIFFLYFWSYFSYSRRGTCC